MTEPLALLAAHLLGLFLPGPVLSQPSLGLLLAALTVVPAVTSGWTPYGLLGLPGEWTPMTGGGAP